MRELGTLLRAVTTSVPGRVARARGRRRTALPRLLVVAGPNGAGKTTITERGLAYEWFGGCEYVNPDLVAQELGDWNDPETLFRAAKLATERREACLREQRSLAFETVFSAPDKPDFVRRALSAGYFVRIRSRGKARHSASAGRVVKTYVEPQSWMAPIVQRWPGGRGCATTAQ